MRQAYTLCSLRIATDGEIPGLVQYFSNSRFDLRIWLNKMPSGIEGRMWAGWYTDANLNIRRAVPEADFHFVYDNGTEFLIQADGGQVWCKWPEGASVDDTAVYLRGPVLGMVLRLRGVTCLHASVIAVRDSAIAVLGPCGSGKSTTAAGFVKLGFRLLADDLAALNVAAGGFQVLPGYPQLNLWPDAAEALYGCEGSLPRIAPADGINYWWDKRYLALEMDSQFQRSPLPLLGVYVLGERASDDSAPRIERLSAKDAFMALTSETYMNYALDESMRVLEFKTLAHLVHVVPVRLVTPHSNPARLMDLCETILRDQLDLAAPQLPV